LAEKTRENRKAITVNLQGKDHPEVSNSCGGGTFKQYPNSASVKPQRRAFAILPHGVVAEAGYLAMA
jgi:hypothetical protein